MNTRDTQRQRIRVTAEVLLWSPRGKAKTLSWKWPSSSEVSISCEATWLKNGWSQLLCFLQKMWLFWSLKACHCKSILSVCYFLLFDFVGHSFSDDQMLCPFKEHETENLVTCLRFTREIRKNWDLRLIKCSIHILRSPAGSKKRQGTWTLSWPTWVATAKVARRNWGLKGTTRFPFWMGKRMDQGWTDQWSVSISL